MRKEKCFIILTFMLGTAVVSSIERSCTTLDHKKGVCIQIDNCPHFRTLLQNQRANEDTLRYVKNAICEFNGKNAKVCCGDNVVISSKLPNQESCGRSSRISISMRIIGGKQSIPGAWPWIAALGYHTFPCQIDCPIKWNCGGTLISNIHVLTAAHCVNNSKHMTLKTVRLGELDLNESVIDGATPLDFRVGRIIVHPNYDKTLMINDIALLKLEKCVYYNVFIQPICLPTPQTMKMSIIENNLLFAVGWGTTNSNPFKGWERNTALMEVEVPLTTCKTLTGYKTILNNSVLCAGKRDADSCQGDSGGPLMWTQGGQYFLMGIVSYGHMICGSPKYPGVYTNVHSVMDWIVKNVNEN